MQQSAVLGVAALVNEAEKISLGMVAGLGGSLVDEGCETLLHGAASALRASRGHPAPGAITRRTHA
jgi:hypothetical protein